MTKEKPYIIIIIPFIGLLSAFNISYADVDSTCYRNCTQMNYSWAFCNDRCSYNNKVPNNDILGKFEPSGLSGGFMRGIEEGQRAAAMQEQIENQRLRNELLKLQLEQQQVGAERHQSDQDLYRAATEQLKSKNYAQAVRLYRSSAEQGNPNAQFSLGSMYADGIGVQQSYLDAAYWFQKSAEQNNLKALTNLGYYYLNGMGVIKNIPESARLTSIAAKQGNSIAQYNFGIMHERGYGVQKNLDEAIMWYEKAAAQGHKVAIKKIAELKALPR